ncbi:helix-turn-helix transcriptional regulator [Natronoglycomyces albus]|uniref:WYL domain-containing protein n=1 Tax=Natronoglycomyces albus TaxID=2811108 RepID=A0A895XW50_9ACTN|nr:WYL domain-containing protein [Natronoglycomyces albus]QSB06756.1 WYL domain-containing protein [Natronoglycomyces albus]
MSTSADLSRLFNLIPYLAARPEGVSYEQAAADFGTTVEKLQRDLKLLWMCGLPGYGPGDLIDIAFDDDGVRVKFDAGMSRPVRLAPQEAMALQVALRVLAGTPGVANHEAITSAMDKIASAAGRAHVPSATVAETVAERNASEFVALVESGRAARITYYSPARDASSERVIDPVEVVTSGGHAYLRAWCRSSESMRQFRLDRIDSCTWLDEEAVTDRVSDEEPAAPTDFLSGQLPVLELNIGTSLRWIAEAYPCEELTAVASGRWRVRLRYRDIDWAKRFILGLGPDAEVIAPEQLRRSVVSEARAALQRYADLEDRIAL